MGDDALDTHILRLSVDLPSDVGSTVYILVDTERRYWCFLPENLDTFNWATALERVGLDTFFWTPIKAEED